MQAHLLVLPIKKASSQFRELLGKLQNPIESDYFFEFSENTLKLKPQSTLKEDSELNQWASVEVQDTDIKTIHKFASKFNMAMSFNKDYRSISIKLVKAKTYHVLMVEILVRNHVAEKQLSEYFDLLERIDRFNAN